MQVKETACGLNRIWLNLVSNFTTRDERFWTLRRKDMRPVQKWLLKSNISLADGRLKRGIRYRQMSNWRRAGSNCAARYERNNIILNLWIISQVNYEQKFPKIIVCGTIGCIIFGRKTYGRVFTCGPLNTSKMVPYTLQVLHAWCIVGYCRCQILR